MSCTKKRFKRKLDALMFEGLVLNKRYGGTQRVYRCPNCKGWHLTTQPQRTPPP